LASACSGWTTTRDPIWGLDTTYAHAYWHLATAYQYAYHHAYTYANWDRVATYLYTHSYTYAHSYTNQYTYQSALLHLHAHHHGGLLNKFEEERIAQSV